MSKKNLTLFIVALILLGFYYFLRPQEGGTQSNSETTQEKIVEPQVASSTIVTSVKGSHNIKNRTYSISIKDFYFDPQTLVIDKGDNIIWINYDPVPHQISINGTSSKILNKGQTFSLVFKESGTFNYRCSSHASMRGQIIVR